jgi:hypothetical protein
MNRELEIRHGKTISFVLNHINKSDTILDLGIPNELSGMLTENEFRVTNTQGEDLDLENDIEKKYGSFDVVTAFEILEHLVSPFELIRKLPAGKLIATVPLRLWFASAYRNKSDQRDQHFHEFEEWQFDWLLEKAGWRIIAKEKWINKSDRIGFRPFLRNITPRFYAVYAERDL